MVQYGPKSASVSIGGAVVAHLKECEESIDVSVIEEYDITGGAPSVLESDAISYGFTASTGYIGTGVLAALVVAGATVTIIFYPRGSTSGMPRITYTGILTGFRKGARRGGGAMLDNVTARLKTRVEDTVT